MGMTTVVSASSVLGRQVLLARSQAGMAHDTIVFLTTCR